MSSLFNNPGTYLGIQYVPTTAETPDIEGLQYMMQQEEARKLQMQNKVQAAKPDTTGLYDKLKGLSGEVNHAASIIENGISEYYQQFDTPEKMISPEAIRAGARLQRTVLSLSNELLNNKEMFKERMALYEDVMPSVYYNNGKVYVDDPETGRVKAVSYSDYEKEKDGLFKNTSPKTINELLDYKMDDALIGELDLDVNQYDQKTTSEYINNHFKSIGANSTSFEGGEQLKGMLAQHGIDPTHLDVEKFKVKIKSGEVNANTLYDFMIKNMDTKAMNSIASQMVERGQNPFEMVSLGKDEKGEDIKVTSLQGVIHEMLTGEVAKSLNTEKEISIEQHDKDSSSSSVSGSGAQTRISNLLNPDYPISDKMRVFGSNDAYTKDLVYNTNTGETVNNVPALVFVPTEEEESLLNGGKPKFKVVDNNQMVIFNGQPAKIGIEDGSGGNYNGAIFYETPMVGNVIVTEIDNGSGQKTQQAVLEKYIFTNESGLSQFKDNEGDSVTYDSIGEGGTGLIERVYESDLKNILMPHGVNEETITNIKLDEPWFKWDHIYKVKIEVPLDNTSAFVDTKDQVSREGNAELERQMQQSLINQETGSEQVNNTLEAMRNFMNAK